MGRGYSLRHRTPAVLAPPQLFKGAQVAEHGSRLIKTVRGGGFVPDTAASATTMSVGQKKIPFLFSRVAAMFKKAATAATPAAGAAALVCGNAACGKALAPPLL